MVVGRGWLWGLFRGRGGIIRGFGVGGILTFVWAEESPGVLTFFFCDFLGMGFFGASWTIGYTHVRERVGRT